MKFTIAALILAGVGLAACADYPTRSASASDMAVNASDTSACFRTSQMRNHTVVDDRTIYVDGGNGIYKVTTGNACFSAAGPSDPLVIKTPGGSGMVCKPIDLDLAVSRSGFVSPCIISGIVRMTPAEVAALPPKLKP